MLAPRIYELIVEIRRQWVALYERIKAFDVEFAAAKAQAGAKRLLSIPGMGALNATALVTAVGDAGTFARGRDLAAWQGLVPRQVTTMSLGGNSANLAHPFTSSTRSDQAA